MGVVPKNGRGPFFRVWGGRRVLGGMWGPQEGEPGHATPQQHEHIEKPRNLLGARLCVCHWSSLLTSSGRFKICGFPNPSQLPAGTVKGSIHNKLRPENRGLTAANLDPPKGRPSTNL